MNLVFETVHGSRLYGLAHEDSDHDLFRVVTDRATKSRHYKDGDLDVTEVGLSLFLERAASGSHQAVEAMFSPYKIWGDESHKEVIESYVVYGTDVVEKYERTIKKFCHGDFKQRRHALRLALNLAGLRKRGRFYPVLSEWEVSMISDFATRYEGQELWGRIEVVQL